MQRLLKGEMESYELEKRYLHCDGHVVWAHLSGSLVRNREGEPLYFVAQVHDITERIRAREELEARERRFRSLIENASDLITIIGPDGTSRYQSPSFERILGYAPEDNAFRASSRVQIDPRRPDEPDVYLDLKAVIDQVYDGGRYEFYLYEGPPEPLLAPADAAWAALRAGYEEAT